MKNNNIILFAAKQNISQASNKWDLYCLNIYKKKDRKYTKIWMFFVYSLIILIARGVKFGTCTWQRHGDNILKCH